MTIAAMRPPSPPRLRLLNKMTPESPKVVGYCRACGKPLDELTVRNSHGTIYCQEHIPMEAHTVPPIPIAAAAAESPYSSPYTAAVPPAPSRIRKLRPGWRLS